MTTPQDIQNTLEQQNTERSKNYKKLLFCQGFIVIWCLYVFELEKLFPFPYSKHVYEIIFGIAGTYNNYLGYQMIRNFVQNKSFLRTMLYLLFFSVSLSLIIGNPIYPLNTIYFRPLILLSMFLSAISFSVVLYFMVLDIFGEKHDTTYRLWGASSIFLGIGILFSFLFMVTELMIPGSLGLPVELSTSTYIYSFNFSFYILSGLDHPFESITMLVRNISVIESIISNLYVVILVGRLLSK